MSDNISEKSSKPDEYIQITLAESSQSVSLEKVRRILRTFMDDIYDYNRELDNNRKGKILTVVDASISDETQRKAVKDMINEAWYNSRPNGQKYYASYPRMDQAVEAIGFSLRSEADKMIEPSPSLEEYNPYKEIN